MYTAEIAGPLQYVWLTTFDGAFGSGDVIVSIRVAWPRDSRTGWPWLSKPLPPCVPVVDDWTVAVKLEQCFIQVLRL